MFIYRVIAVSKCSLISYLVMATQLNLDAFEIIIAGLRIKYEDAYVLEKCLTTTTFSFVTRAYPFRLVK